MNVTVPFEALNGNAVPFAVDAPGASLLEPGAGPATGCEGPPFDGPSGVFVPHPIKINARRVMETAKVLINISPK